MSENVLAVLIPFGLLGGMFLWVPLLDALHPRCRRFLRSRRRAGRSNASNGTTSAKVTEPVSSSVQ